MDKEWCYLVANDRRTTMEQVFGDNYRAQLQFHPIKEPIT